VGIWKDQDTRTWKWKFQYRRRLYGGGGYPTRREASAAREARRKEVIQALPPGRMPKDVSLSLAGEAYLEFAEKRYVVTVPPLRSEPNDI